MGINSFRNKQPPCPVDHRHLGPGTESRIDPHDSFSRHRGLQKQFPQVGGKYPDGMFLSGFPQFITNLPFHSRLEQPFITVFNRSEEHTSELQSRPHLVCRLLLEKKKKKE